MKYFITFLILSSSLIATAQIRPLKVEPNHSTIGFRIPIAGFSIVSGKFTDYTIDIDWNDEDFSASTISATIQATSINTGIPDRDTHLQSEDFFDAATFPTITFVSDSIQRKNFSEFTAYGKFTMHGVSKNIVLPFEIVKMDGNTIGFRSRTKLNRLDYGVGAGFTHTSMPDFLAAEIQVEIDFWTKKRKKENE